MHAHTRKQEMNCKGSQKPAQRTINRTYLKNKILIRNMDMQTVRYRHELSMNNNIHYF